MAFYRCIVHEVGPSNSGPTSNPNPTSAALGLKEIFSADSGR
jgi:hypothetical protein